MKRKSVKIACVIYLLNSLLYLLINRFFIANSIRLKKIEPLAIEIIDNIRVLSNGCNQFTICKNANTMFIVKCCGVDGCWKEDADGIR